MTATVAVAVAGCFSLVIIIKRLQCSHVVWYIRKICYQILEADLFVWSRAKTRFWLCSRWVPHQAIWLARIRGQPQLVEGVGRNKDHRVPHRT